MSVRPLALALIAQVLLGLALLVWAAQGFPGVRDDGGGSEPARTETARPEARQPAPAPGAAAAADDSARAAQVPPRARVNRFQGARAFALLREQVETFGPRPAGSEALRRLADHLRGLLPRGRFEAVDGHPGLRNVVGSIPGRRPAILLGAHYDVEAVPEGFVGANDGAAGTAAVVYLARALARVPRERGQRELRFVLFDGEEEPAGCEDFLACGLRGSSSYAARHARELSAMVLLDYIAERENLRFPREGGSDPALWARLRSSARRVGVGAVFPDAASGTILDDHTPFTRRGVPAIDLIDFEYPHRDTLADTVDKVSARSLDAVGETVLDLLQRLRTGRRP